MDRQDRTGPWLVVLIYLAAAAYAYAEAHGARQIVLVAESMGGAIAGQFLTRSPHAAKTLALALDSPALDFPAWCVTCSPPAACRSAVLRRAAAWICFS